MPHSLFSLPVWSAPLAAELVDWSGVLCPGGFSQLRWHCQSVHALGEASGRNHRFTVRVVQCVTATPSTRAFLCTTLASMRRHSCFCDPEARRVFDAHTCGTRQTTHALGPHRTATLRHSATRRQRHAVRGRPSAAIEEEAVLWRLPRALPRC